MTNNQIKKLPKLIFRNWVLGFGTCLDQLGQLD